MNDHSSEAPGVVLREAREQRELSREDVAAELNLLVSQVKALESNEYSCFNAELFVKGFLRSYSDLLGCDSMALLKDCERHLHTLSAKTERRPTGVANSRDAFLKVVFAGVAAAVLWALAVWLVG